MKELFTALTKAQSEMEAAMKDSANPFYIYRHATPDGEVFYVGKGSGERLNQTGNRGEFWKRIVKKYGYTASVIEAVASEAEAYEREIYWIAYYRAIGQCGANFTNGGDGVRVTNRWWGDKISAAMTGMKRAQGTASKAYNNFASKELLLGLYLTQGKTSTEIAAMFDVSHAVVCNRLAEFGIARRSKGRESLKIRCDSDGVIFDSISDAARHYGVFRENISKVLRGAYKSTGNKTFSYLEHSNG